MKEKIIILEELEDRLDIRSQEWISSIRKRDTAEEVMWARSRFATEEEKQEIIQRLVQANENLRFFQLSLENPVWEDLGELEGTFITQLMLLERIQEESQRFEKEKFLVPATMPPFSEDKITLMQEEFERLYLARAKRLARERKEAEQQDLRWILILILFGGVCLLLV